MSQRKRREEKREIVLFVCLFSVGVTQSVPRTDLRSDSRREIKEEEERRERQGFGGSKV